MHHAHAAARAEQTGANLHQAARITGRNELGMRGRDVSHFGREHGIRGIRLDEIVDPGGATAVLRAVERY
jgi:hypothetical protein